MSLFNGIVLEGYEENKSLFFPNNTNTTPTPIIEPTEVATYTGAAIMVIFLVLGLLGNMLIMLAIVTNRRVWNVINTFIISLAINDILTYLLIVVFIINSYVCHGWCAGAVVCALNPELTVLFTGCSLWHTALIAIHRYIVVCHNNHYSRMSKGAYVAFVLIMARAIPAVCVFPGFSLNTSRYAEKMLRCILKPSQGMRMFIVTMLLIVLPCLIVVLCYAFVFGFVWRIARRMSSRCNNSILKREVQITKMFGMVFFMILLGFIPYAIIRNLDRNNSIGANVYVVVTVVYAVATCSNPFVYGVMSTEIRRACAAALKNLMECLHMDACFSCAKINQSIQYTDAISVTERMTTKFAKTTSNNSSDSSGCQKFTFCVSKSGDALNNTGIVENGGTGGNSVGVNNRRDSDPKTNVTEASECLLERQDTVVEVDNTEQNVTNLVEHSHGDVML